MVDNTGTIVGIIIAIAIAILIAVVGAAVWYYRRKSEYFHHFSTTISNETNRGR